ncbi:hypothetical protein Q668_20780 [Alcanivorax sp. PN-3]|nr:hypothetical protein Q668_20780 [Alcanivorax sp. PN-3]KYZ84494.1 hypothetical protein A3Q32_09225 [Alcanivorax sp. KX64203]
MLHGIHQNVLRFAITMPKSSGMQSFQPALSLRRDTMRPGRIPLNQVAQRHAFHARKGNHRLGIATP